MSWRSHQLNGVNSWLCSLVLFNQPYVRWNDLSASHFCFFLFPFFLLINWYVYFLGVGQSSTCNLSILVLSCERFECFCGSLHYTPYSLKKMRCANFVLGCFVCCRPDFTCNNLIQFCQVLIVSASDHQSLIMWHFLEFNFDIVWSNHRSVDLE